MNTQFSKSLKQLTYIVIGPTLFLKTFFLICQKKKWKMVKNKQLFFQKNKSVFSNSPLPYYVTTV